MYQLTELSEHYPRSCQPNGPPPPKGREVGENGNTLYPVKLTYSFWKQGAIFAFFNIQHKLWDKTTGREYIRSLALNGDYANNHILKPAFAARQDPLSIDEIKNQIFFPPLWNGSHDLLDCIETPMHLLFLGIVKSLHAF